MERASKEVLFLCSERPGIDRQMATHLGPPSREEKVEVRFSNIPSKPKSMFVFTILIITLSASSLEGGLRRVATIRQSNHFSFCGKPQ
jgi:hypothetical protein